MILYIKQQKYDLADFIKPTYKFHIAYCSTLEWMERENRFKSRYVVTQRADGKFLIDIIERYSGIYHEENALYKLDICKNCLATLRKHYPTNSLFNFGNFNIDDFIKKYNTKHRKKPSYTPKTMPKNEYSNNWSKLSKQIRGKANYTCEKCKANMNKKRHLLHVHHKDGVKWNNALNNLAVLCAACHLKEPGHQAMYKKVI